ncbi:MAG: hypothetical protein MJZ37_08925 [Bacilli bacterium]|nr:hypothetical protein [Bacilli bacterium]
MNEALLKLELESIELQLQKQDLKMDEIKKLISDSFLYSDIPAFCNLQTAAEKKGIKASNLYKRHWQQPCCGKNYKRLNGIRVWARNEIIEWLSISDDDLENYAKKYGVDISKFFKDGKTVSRC